MTSEHQPWERQTGERPKPWAAFCIYRDLGPLRSINKAFQQHQRQLVAKGELKPDALKDHPPRWWGTWSSDFNWVVRSAAYDDHIEAADRAQFERERIQAREDRRKLIRVAKSKLAKMLNKLEPKMKPDETPEIPKVNDVVNLMRLVIQEERAEYDDEPTQRHEHSGPEGSAIRVDVIDEALRKIYGDQPDSDKDEE